MTKEANGSASIGDRFMALVQERGFSRRDLNDYLSISFSAERRKVSDFLREGRRASADVREALIRFAKDKLEMTLDESWFDDGWHPSAPIEVFANANKKYNSFLQSACGNYVHISAKVGLPGEEVTDPPWRCRAIKISNFGDYFGFEIGNPAICKGYAVCHGDTIYLTGFDSVRYKEVIFVVLRPAIPTLAENGITFFGLHTGPLDMGGMPNGLAVGKRVALVAEATWNSWPGSQNIPNDIKQWLLESGATLSVTLFAEQSDED